MDEARNICQDRTVWRSAAAAYPVGYIMTISMYMNVEKFISSNICFSIRNIFKINSASAFFLNGPSLCTDFFRFELATLRGGSNEQLAATQLRVTDYIDSSNSIQTLFVSGVEIDTYWLKCWFVY